ncbi:MAG TPA: hypothetical protein VFZ59_23910, partial [Verrucomicrobiae bacterium]|nr:hypothetical protein [Verrucomicrobiae bacterium]
MPTEFGHNLSVTPGIIVFMTRMGNPMRQASFSEAGRELFSTLFLMRNLKNQPDDLVRGQAPYERWRDPYLSTFDLSCAVVCALAIAGAIVWIWRKRRAGWQALMYLHRPGGALFLATLAWSGLSSGALFVFYLRFPNFSFRYLLDFAPAFTGFALLLWLLLPKRFSWFALNALAVWLGYEVLTSQVRSAPVPLLARDKIPTDLVRMEGRRIAEFDGSYDATNHPAKTALAYNGNGWAEEDG